MMKKIDIHLHVALEDCARIYNHVKFSGCAAMKEHLSQLGIVHAVIMSLEIQDDAMISNHAAAEIARRFPETYSWFCNIPTGVKEPYSYLKRMKEQGAKGLGEWVTHLPLTHPYMEEIMGACEDLELPILFHISPEPENQYGIIDEPGLFLLEEALKKFPRLMMIGHSQPFWYEISKNRTENEKERQGYPEGPVEAGGRLIDLMDHYPNLHGDLSANSGGNAIMRDPQFGLDFMEKYQDRLFFGTDMANISMEFPLGRWLDKKVETGKISKEAYSKICAKNACKKILKETMRNV